MEELWAKIKQHPYWIVAGGVVLFAIFWLLFSGNGAAPAGDNAGADAANEYAAQQASSAAQAQTAAQLSAQQNQDAAALGAAQIQSNTQLGLGQLQLQDDTQSSAATTAQTKIAADSANALATISAGVTDTQYNDELTANLASTSAQLTGLENTNATNESITNTANTLSAGTMRLEINQSAQTTALSIAAQQQATALEAGIASQTLAAEATNQAQQNVENTYLTNFQQAANLWASMK